MIPVNKKITVAGDEHVVYYAFTGRDEQNNLDNPEQIAWDNTPNLRGDHWFDNDGRWDCLDYINWHKQLLAHFGDKATANQAFLDGWNKHLITDSTYQSCMSDDGFVKYFQSQGIDPRDGWAKITDSITNSVTNIAGGAENLTKGVKDAAGGIDNTVNSVGNVLRWLPWIALAIGLIIAAAFGYSYYNKNLK